MRTSEIHPLPKKTFEYLMEKRALHCVFIYLPMDKKGKEQNLHLAQDTEFLERQMHESEIADYLPQVEQLLAKVDLWCNPSDGLAIFLDTVYATNYKYLHNVKTEEVASVPVELSESKVAAFNVKDSEYNQDDWGVYNMNFYIPEGRILAAYDSNGKLLRTAESERFKDVNLPMTFKKAVLDRFPELTIFKDVYLVNYHEDKGVTKKYKLKLENRDETICVKKVEKGEFLYGKSNK